MYKEEKPDLRIHFVDKYLSFNVLRLIVVKLCPNKANVWLPPFLISACHFLSMVIKFVYHITGPGAFRVMDSLQCFHVSFSNDFIELNSSLLLYTTLFLTHLKIQNFDKRLKGLILCSTVSFNKYLSIRVTYTLLGA